MVSISDQEDVDLRIKQLIGRGSEKSFDDSGDENQSDSELLKQIVLDLSFKEQFGKPINTTLDSIISEIWQEPLPKDILLKNLIHIKYSVTVKS